MYEPMLLETSTCTTCAQPIVKVPYHLSAKWVWYWTHGTPNKTEGTACRLTATAAPRRDNNDGQG